MATAPHSSGKNVRSYPVWVGNLTEDVTEALLYETFRAFGTIHSVKVMVDENRKPKGFAYVNFSKTGEAEYAAHAMDNHVFYGSTIKTKGPDALKQEGHLDTRPISPDYRPFTDCAFFMEGAKCKKGSHCPLFQCPYRHSEISRSSSVVCSSWLEKRCLKLNCPYRHPGGREKGSKRSSIKDPTVFVASSPSQTFLKCAGKCGEPKCSALFVSGEDLAKHVEASRQVSAGATGGLPQCVQCRAIFPSHAEYQDHLQTCWARASVTSSTEYSSDSPDVEVLSDTDTGEFQDPDNSFGAIAPAAKGKGLQQKSSPTKMKGGMASGGGKRRQRTASGSSASEDRLVKNSASFESQYLGVKGGGGKDSMSYDPGSFNDSSDSYFSMYGSGNGEDSDSDSDSEGDPMEYTVGEMARLLSLNEQDMMGSIGDSGDDSDDKEEVILRGGGSTIPGTGISLKPDPARAESRAPASADISPSRQVSTSTHKMRLEPVGVFWDIENCPVPVDKSAFGVAAKMRHTFITGKREAEFMCVCDITKERKEVTDDLHKAQVTLVHVNAIAKNAADDKLRHSLRRFAQTYPAPATVVLISGDVNFSIELNDMMNQHNLNVVLVHNVNASNALKVFARELVCYEEFIADVEPPSRQAPDQCRVVVVSGLPKQMHYSRISSRLDRISDNCGGKVLRVDTTSGTAKVLFRTNEWAKKALKRMNGEDVFGHKISTSLETPPPHAQQQQGGGGGGGGMSHLIGANLAKSFPPPPQKQPGGVNVGMRTPPPPMYRPHFPPLPGPAAANMMPPFNSGMRPPYPPQPPLPPRGVPQAPPPPRMLVPSALPPPPPQLPHFPRPPVGTHTHLPKGSLPRPEGKILIFKIPPHEEPALRQNISHLQGNAFISAETMLLWHGYSELQVVLRVDFIQTAIIRKEEIVHTLYERGELGAEAASKFIETCTKSVGDALRRFGLQWEVTTCGWSSEEEENRVIRSNVIALLRRNPTCWTKFSNFKKRYFETYSSAISEMTVHNACGGAVQILSDYSSTASQIIIFYDFSPLVKIVNNTRLHTKLKNDFTKLLSMQPEKKIKLLDFVNMFLSSKIGPLPTSSSGKMLQEVITSVPNVTLVGNKPSNIFVTLNTASGSRGTGNGAGGAEPRAVVPHNLAGISASFCHLLRESGPNGIPYKTFQQQYQSFFHGSFRVADYLPGDKGVKDLISVCQGIKIVTVSLPDGKKEEWVRLDDGSTANPPPPPPSSTAHASALSAAAAAVPKVPLNAQTTTITTNRTATKSTPATTSTTTNFSKPVVPPTPSPIPQIPQRTSSTPAPPSVKQPPSSSSNTGPVDSHRKEKLLPVETIAVEFRQLLELSPNRQLPLRIFQQSYQTYFHHPFRISTYMSSSSAGMRDLLHECHGIQLKQLKLPTGKSEEYVCLEREKSAPVEAKLPQTPSKPPPAASSAEGTASYLIPDHVDRFRQDCIEVLSTVKGHSVSMLQFPELFSKVKKKQFLLVDYKAKKMMHLLEAIPEVVQVLTVGDAKIIKLCDIDPKKACEKEVEVLVYEQPRHMITLDRFMMAYEQKYSRRLHFYGHPKLLKLLEEFSNTIRVDGNGPSRPIHLLPLRRLACELTELLFPLSDPMPINKIVPAYKERFKKDLDYQKDGFPKLIRALEALPDLIIIRGSGPTRTVRLKSVPHYTSLFASLSSSSSSGRRSPLSLPNSPRTSTTASLPQAHLLTDEVTAILMSTHNFKMSLVELTKGYNQAFRANKGPKVDSSELLQALQGLPNFKITGAGTPICYVQVAQSSKVTTPPSRAKSGPTLSPATKVDTGAAKPPADRGDTGEFGEQSAKKSLLFDEPSVPGTSASSISPPSLSKTPPPYASGASGAMGQQQQSPSKASEEDEARRLGSETRRLLLCHHEHAMTLTELVERFTQEGDSASPTCELLYKILKKATGTGADKNPSQKRFEISYFQTDVGASLVQLNRADCLWKLGEDLLNLFVYHPTADLTLAISQLESLYLQCYSRKLQTAVYAANDINQVLRAKQLKKVIRVNGTKCSPCAPFNHHVLVSLLTELLFARGKECISLDCLPELYLDHFKVPLPLEHFGAKNLISFMNLPRVSDVITLSAVSKSEFKPVLKPVPHFTEQIRHLLTMHGGHIALDQLEKIYTAEFGAPVYPEYGKYLRRRLPHESFLVANLASHRWLVWAPTGHPRSHQRSRPQEKGGMAASLEASPTGSGGDGGGKWPTFSESDDRISEGVETSLTGHGVKDDVEKVDESREKCSLDDPSYLSTTSYLLQSATATSDDCMVDLSDLPRTAAATTTTATILEPISTPAAELERSSPPLLPPLPPLLPAAADAVNLDPNLPIFAHSFESSSMSKDREEGGGQGGEGRESSSSSPTPESPYDFLKNHPDLLAELSKPSTFAGVETDLPEEDLRILTQVLAVQRLQELGMGITKKPAPSSSSSSSSASLSAPPPPPSPYASFLDVVEPGGSPVPVPSSPQAQPRATGHRHSNSNGNTSSSTAQDSNRPFVVRSAAEYLESGLSPDQVLGELQQLKERCGGVLRPEQMSPFLDYFGELSSRELDRIDALEGKKPKKSGGGGGRKRNMAIRFPSQQPDHTTNSTTAAATAGFDGQFGSVQFDESLFVGKLPVADFSDSSNDEDSSSTPVVPINRNEYIRRFLEGGDPDNNIVSEEQLSLLHSNEHDEGCEDLPPRPLLPPSQSGADGSFEALFDPSKIKF